MKIQLPLFWLLLCCTAQTIAQLKPTKINNVFTIESTGSGIIMVNDSIQLEKNSSSFSILKNFTKTGEVKFENMAIVTNVVNKGRPLNEIFVVTNRSTIEKNNSQIFLYKIDLANNSFIQVPMKNNVFSRSNKFEVTNYAYDRINNLMFFTDYTTLIQYDPDKNEFVNIPFYPGFDFNLNYADSGFVYIMKKGGQSYNDTFYLQSFHYTNPGEIKNHREINSIYGYYFNYLVERKQMFVKQYSKTYLVSGSTLKKMPDSFALHKIRGDIYGSLLKRGIVLIKYLNNDKAGDTLQLDYEATQDISMEDKLVISYNTYRKIVPLTTEPAKPKTTINTKITSNNNNTSNTNITAYTFPYSIPFFQKFLQQYAKEREDLFTGYDRYTNCLSSGKYKSDCDFYLRLGSKGRAEKLLTDCKELQELLSKHKDVFLKNITTDYSTTKAGFEFDESKLRSLIKLYK